MTASRSAVVRPEQPGDAAAIRALHLVAFTRDGQPGEGEARIVDELRASDAYIPELSLVAVVGDTIAGHLILSRAVIETDSGDVPCLGLGPLAVLPGHEQLRAGTALMRHGLAEARRLGHRLVIVLGHPKYYRRFGFRPASARGVSAPWKVPDEAFMILELEAGALAGIRGVARYAPAFDPA